MPTAPSTLALLGVPLAGIAALALGLGLLLSRELGRGRGQLLGLLVLTLLIASSAAAVLLKLPSSIGLSLATLAAAWVLGWLLRTRYPARAALAALCGLARPQVQALLLLVGGLVAIIGQVSWLQLQEARLAIVFDDLLPEERPAIRQVDRPAFTDQGTRIPLHAVADRSSFPHTAESERKRHRDSALSLRVIRTAPPNPDCNCHGWIFTGGRFWLKGESVERILAENGYHEVTEPQPDDLVIYRDAEKKVIHTAIVRARTADGLVLLESKFGQMGRFLHAPEDQSYSRNWRYYRSTRQGHLLRGLEKTADGGDQG